MRYRVDDLAEACGVTVDTVRYYQTLGLLPRPAREGRIAWYDDEHVWRLERIKELKERGFTLAMIGRALDGRLDPSEEALAGALAEPLPGEQASDGVALTLEELAERTGLTPALLEVLERERLLIPRVADGERRYTSEDIAAVQAGLALLEAGVPLSELLELARRHDEAMRATAEHAVDLFARFVRDPIRADAPDDHTAAARTVEALRTMLPATGTIVSHHFRRLVLAAARARLEGDELPALGADPPAEP